MLNIEIHSQESAKRIREVLVKLSLVDDIFITEFASRCTTVLDEKDEPFLRIYFTEKRKLIAVLRALEPFRKKFRIEVPQLFKFLPRNT